METNLKRDGFGHVKRPVIASKCDDRYLTQYQYVPNHDSLGFDLTCEGVEPVDMVAETNKFKNECGMEAMKILIAAGQKTPADFADDGSGSADLTQFPDNVNDAFQEVNKQKAAASASVNALGGSVEEAIKSGNLDAYVKGLVEKQLAAAKAEQPTNEEKVNA